MHIIFLNIRTMGNSRKFPIAQMSCATAFLWSFAQLQVVDFLLHRDILVGPSARAARRACRHECSAANLFSQIVPPLLVVRCHDNVIASLGLTDDTLAERLRRRPAKPMGSPRVGSNPTGVVFEILERGAARAAQDTMHPENMVDVALQFPTEIAKAATNERERWMHAACLLWPGGMMLVRVRQVLGCTLEQPLPHDCAIRNILW